MAHVLQPNPLRAAADASRREAAVANARGIVAVDDAVAAADPPALQRGQPRLPSRVALLLVRTVTSRLIIGGALCALAGGALRLAFGEEPAAGLRLGESPLYAWLLLAAGALASWFVLRILERAVFGYLTRLSTTKTQTFDTVDYLTSLRGLLAPLITSVLTLELRAPLYGMQLSPLIEFRFERTLIMTALLLAVLVARRLGIKMALRKVYAAKLAPRVREAIRYEQFARCLSAPHASELRGAASSDELTGSPRSRRSLIRVVAADDPRSPEGIRRALVPTHFLEHEKFWRQKAYLQSGPFGVMDARANIVSVSVRGDPEAGVVAATDAGGAMFDRLVAVQQLRASQQKAPVQPAADSDGDGGGDDEDDDEELTRDDITPCFLSEDDATAAFRLFDLDGGGGASRREFQNSIKMFVKSWEETARALDSFESLSTAIVVSANIIMGIVVLGISIGVFEIDFSSIGLPLVTALLPVSFAIAPTLQRLADNLYLLLVVAPYDVGDAVIMEGQPSIAGGRQLAVLKVAFSHTLFTEFSTGRTITVANHRVLAFYSVINLTRSSTAEVSRNFAVTSIVREDTLKVFKANLLEYLLARPLDWYPGFWVAYVPSSHPNAFEISVNVKHRLGWSEFMEVNTATGALSRWCVADLRGLGLLFEQPALPIVGAGGVAAAPAPAPAT